MSHFIPHASFYVVSFFLSEQTIMKDKWMNIGYEDDDLKPFIEPLPDINDPVRIGKVHQCILGQTRPTSSYSAPIISVVWLSCLRLLYKLGERGLCMLHALS